MTDREYADWTIEALRDYEERLYDAELAGADTWHERDQVLWELALRDPARPAGPPPK